MNTEKIIASPKRKQNTGALAALATRKGQLWALIILSALTMTIPYYIQGALSGGKSPTDIGATVWLFDHSAWAIRAIVEGLVIGYIARTNAKNRWESAILWALEIALIALIAITLGPTLYASLNGDRLSLALTEPMQWGWAFALACYMPLMVLGASYAYKVQPDDAATQGGASSAIAELQAELAARTAGLASAEADALAAQAQLNERTSELAEAQEQLAAAQESVRQTHGKFTEMQAAYAKRSEQAEAAQVQIAAMQSLVKATQGWDLLSATAKARWVAENCNGDKPAAAELAKALGVAATTVSRAYAEVQK